MGAEGTALGEEIDEPGVLLGIISGAGVHHPQAEALHLLRQEAPVVQSAVGRGVGGQPRRLAQRVHWVGQDHEQSAEPGLPGLLRELLYQRAVGGELGHADILHAAAHRWDGFRGGEDEHVAVKKLVFRYCLYFR